MDANEYLEENHPDLMIYIKAYIPTEVDLTAALNGYHQAKSKEEAGERLVEAWKLIPKDLNAYIVAQIDKALTLAAFGKEGEG